MSTDIFGIGLSGLLSAQLGMATTSNNISNSSTPGYTVETPVFSESSGQFTGSGFFGSGVTTVTVQRSFSQFLTTQLNSAQSTNSALTANQSMASQLNNLIGSPTSGIAAAITAYFTGLQNIANSPSSLAQRQTAISDAQSLANQLNAAGQQYDQLRQGVNQQLTQSVTQINTLTQQIANLNGQVAAASAQGQPPNQLLDQRDQAVSQLSQLVGVSVVQNSQGDSVFLSSGQPLVLANQSFNLGTTTSPSDPSELAVSYNGLAGTTPTGPTQFLSSSAISGGTVGGLLAFRSQTLDPAEAQLGAIATSFAAQVNAQNQLGLDLSGKPGGPLFTVGTPQAFSNLQNKGNATLSVSFANPSQPTADDFSLSFDGTNYTLTDTTTGAVVGTPSATPPNGTTAIGGLMLNITAGSMTAGDSFTIQPTRGALDNFALKTTSASAIAAASPVLASAASTNSGSATITQGTVSTNYNIPSAPTTLTYNSATGQLSGFPVGSTVTVNGGAPITIAAGTTVPYTSGDTYTINTTPATTGPNAVSFTINGSPSNGDTFTIGPNTGANDGRNALAMSNIVSNPVLSNGQSTLTGAYANYVNDIGNVASQLQSASTAQTALVSQIQSSQQSVSGVNLDEEASSLLKYQQLYQASSKVISTAESMFQTLISAIQ